MGAVRKRIRATKNVAKLTSVMKLVASSKLRSVEQALARAKPFGLSLLESVGMHEEPKKAEGEEAKKLKRLVVLMTTDRGLCGSVNSSLARVTREYIKERKEANEEFSFIVLGEKGRVQVARDYLDDMVFSVDQAFDKDPIFPLASALAERVVKNEFDTLTFCYNRYENAAKFHNSRCHFPQLGGLPVGVLPAKFKGFDVEPENNEETLVNLMEYAVAGSMYYMMLESQACEVSQRVSAMDNATTNAKDMVDRFTIIYNRARQAKITTELTEIVAGAEALND